MLEAIENYTSTNLIIISIRSLPRQSMLISYSRAKSTDPAAKKYKTDGHGYVCLYSPAK